MALIEQGRIYDAFTDTFCGMELITLENALGLIDDAPAIDAAPVVHGRWVKAPDGYIHCSHCGRRRGAVQDRFCGRCGARMNGGEEHETD